MGAVKRFRDRIDATISSGGTANAQTLTYAVAPTAYNLGDCFTFLVGPGLTNTGATTLNVNGLGAASIKVGSNNLSGGELIAGQIATVYYDSPNFQLASPIRTYLGATPSNPTGTSSLTGVMAGLNQTFVPKRSGVVLVLCTGVGRSNQAGSGGEAQIRYGAGGSNPLNGAAPTGTAVGNIAAWNSVSANADVPFMCAALITGLTSGSTYWLDVSEQALVSGTASISSLSFIAIEL